MSNNGKLFALFNILIGEIPTWDCIFLPFLLLTELHGNTVVPPQIVHPQHKIKMSLLFCTINHVWYQVDRG